MQDLIKLNSESKVYGVKNAEDLQVDTSNYADNIDSNLALPALDTWEVISIDTYLTTERIKALNLERAARSKVQQHVRLLEKVIIGINKLKKDKDFIKLQADDEKLKAFKDKAMK